MHTVLSKVGLSPHLRCSCRHEATMHVIWDSERGDVFVGHCFVCGCERFERF
jgi:hypothetical protein